MTDALGGGLFYHFPGKDFLRCFFAGLWRELCDFDIFSQSQKPQKAYRHPGHVNFPGEQSVLGRFWKRVMVVVPAFPISDETDPPAVGGEVVF